MSFVSRFAVVALCAAPLAVAAAQTNSIPSATNPGDAKQIPSPTGSADTMPAPTPGVLIDPSKSMDVVLSGAERDIVALAEAMPAERYDFAPKNSDFAATLKPDYTGVRTFGQEIAHIAAGNYLYVALATGAKPTVDPMAISKGADKATAVASLKASFAAMHQAVATLTPANAFQHAGRGPNDTRLSVLAGGLAHQRDHYGQLVEYARMNGITPPASAGRPPANPAKP